MNSNMNDVNEQFLILNKNNRVNELCNQFITDVKYKALVIRSETGTGKTYLLNEYIERYQIKQQRKIRLLLLSTRQSYARSMCNSSLKKLNITNYLDYKKNKNNDKDKLYEVDRLCISMEGLNNLMFEKWRPYDIVVLDESETICRHMFSPTIKNGSYDVFLKIRKLIEYSKKVILLDADAGICTDALINNIDYEKIIKINNTFEKQKKEYYFTKDKESFLIDIKSDIIFNRNAYIVCLSKTEADNLHNELKDMFRIYNKKVLVITGDSSDKVKKSLMDVNKEWIKYNYIITTSTTGAGVDFNIQNHFQNVYGHISCGSSCPLEFIQILDRVRNPINNNVSVLVHSNIKIPDNDSFLYTIENSKYILEDRKINTIICNSINKTIYDESEDLIKEEKIFIEKDKDYSTLTYQNYLNTVLNSSSNNYLLVLKQLLEKRGHLVIINTIKFKQALNKTKKHEKYNDIKIANMPLIEAEKLILNDDKTYEECRILDKTNLCNRIGIHIAKRDNEQVNEIIDIIESPAKKNKINRILKTFVKDDHAYVMKDFLNTGEKIYTEDIERINQNVMNIFNKLNNTLNYDFTDNFIISADDMTKNVKEFKKIVTNTELKTIETKKKVNFLKLIKKVYSKHGMNMRDVRSSIRNKQGNPRKVVTAYKIEYEKDIYSCINLIANKLGSNYFNNINIINQFDKYRHLQITPKLF